MAKFHNTDEGPKPCSASKKPCPVGGEHFESKEAAQATFEKNLNSKHGGETKALKKTPSEAVIREKLSTQLKEFYGPETKVEVINEEELPKLLEEAAKAKAEGKFVVIEQQSEEYHSDIDDLLSNSPDEGDYETEEEWEEAYEDYEIDVDDAMQSAKFNSPTTSTINYVLHIHNSKKEFETAIENDADEYLAPEGDNYYQYCDYTGDDGMVSQMVDRTGNQDRGYRGFLKFYK